jgi:hypothetical protein
MVSIFVGKIKNHMNSEFLTLTDQYDKKVLVMIGSITHVRETPNRPGLVDLYTTGNQLITVKETLKEISDALMGIVESDSTSDFIND